MPRPMYLASFSKKALDAMKGIYHGSTLLAIGHAVHEGCVEAAKPDGERETAYRARNLPFVKRLAKRLSDPSRDRKSVV